MGPATKKKSREQSSRDFFLVEVWSGFEPLYMVLQTTA